MRFLSIVLILVAVATASAFAPFPRGPHYDLNDAPLLFEKFIKDYNRHYKDAVDKYRHYLAFYLNLIKINKLNDEQSTAIFDINKFADYTEEESKNLFGLGTEKP